MRYEDISPVMRQYLGCWEGFRKLGFPSNDLFLLIARSVRSEGHLSAFLLLKHQGKEFSTEIGPIVGTEKDFGDEYTRVATEISEGRVDQASMDRIWQESIIYSNKGALVVALQMKGIQLPALSHARSS